MFLAASDDNDYSQKYLPGSRMTFGFSFHVSRERKSCFARVASAGTARKAQRQKLVMTVVDLSHRFISLGWLVLVFTEQGNYRTCVCCKNLHSLQEIIQSVFDSSYYERSFTFANCTFFPYICRRVHGSIT